MAVLRDELHSSINTFHPPLYTDIFKGENEYYIEPQFTPPHEHAPVAAFDQDDATPEFGHFVRNSLYLPPTLNRSPSPEVSSLVPVTNPHQLPVRKSLEPLLVFSRDSRRHVDPVLPVLATTSEVAPLPWLNNEPRDEFTGRRAAIRQLQNHPPSIVNRNKLSGRPPRVFTPDPHPESELTDLVKEIDSLLITASSTSTRRTEVESSRWSARSTSPNPDHR